MPALIPALVLSTVIPRDIRAALDRLAADWAAKKLDGKLTPIEFLQFIAKGLDEAMWIVAPLKDGQTKKQAVLAFAGYLFDIFEPFIVARFSWWAWISAFFGGSLKDEFLLLVDGAIELFYNAKFKPAA